MTFNKPSRTFLRSLLLALIFSQSVFGATVEVYFSPKGGCQEVVCKAIRDAKKEVLCEAYVLSSKPIISELVTAKARGVDVQVVEDAKESKTQYGNPQLLVKSGISVYVDGRHPISHSKVLILDAHITITGSYNWTGQAENNHENLVVINSEKIAAAYRKDFEDHKAHSIQVR